MAAVVCITLFVMFVRFHGEKRKVNHQLLCAVTIMTKLIYLVASHINNQPDDNKSHYVVITTHNTYAVMDAWKMET